MSDPTTHVLSAPTPAIDRLSPPDRDTPELKRHLVQVAGRSAKLNRKMMDLAAFGVNPGSGDMSWTQPVAEVGTFTYFTLTRHWAHSLDFTGRVTSLLFRGYKSRVDGGRVVVGGPAGNVCAYDMRFRPFEAAAGAGRILSTFAPGTIRCGLDLDAETERVVKGEAPIAHALTLPTFWAAFGPAFGVPDVEDCPAVRDLVLAAVRPGYVGPTLPGLKAPGGEVTYVGPGEFARGVEGVAVGFGGTEDSPAECVALPPTAVLRPHVRKGVHLAAGVCLADYVPRRLYPNLHKLREIYGAVVADTLVEQVLQAHDREIGGLYARRVEFCPAAVGRADKVYEDVSALVGPAGNSRVQVVGVKRGPGALLVEDRPAVYADLYHIREDWVSKFHFWGSRRGQSRRQAGARAETEVEIQTEVGEAQ